jgi:Ni/Co efflux regulator RcnB
MKRSLVISAFLLGLLVAGCAANPAAAPVAPAADATQQDRDRDRDQDKDRDRNKDQDRDKDQGRQDKAASCPPGQHPSTDNGRAICVRD